MLSNLELAPTGTCRNLESKLLSPELNPSRPTVNVYNHEPKPLAAEPLQVAVPNLGDLRAARIPANRPIKPMPADALYSAIGESN